MTQDVPVAAAERLDQRLADLARGLADGGRGVRVLVHAADPGPGADAMASAFPAADLVVHDRYDDLDAVLDRARPQACLSYRFGPGYPRATLVEGPAHPAYVHVAGTGFDHLLPFDPAAVMVCNSAGFQAPVMADYALAAIYAINLRLSGFMARQTRREWSGQTLRAAEGQRAVILGTGPIGAAIARRLRAAGLGVSGISRSGRPHPDFDAVDDAGALPEVLGGADHLVLSIRAPPRRAA